MLVSVQLDGKERALTLAEFEDSVRAGAIGPHTPVRVGPDAAWVEANRLPAWAAVVDSPGARLRRAWEQPRIPWITALICGVIFKIWLWTAGTPLYNPLVEAGTRWTPAIVEQGEGWRLLTYGLLHAGFGHVANNLLVLAYTGAALESLVGGRAVLALFLVSCAGGGVLSGVFAPEVRALGASGGDFGFLAATVVVGARYRDVIPVQARARFGGFIFALTAWMLINGLFSERVDNLAHLGGLLGGAAFATFLLPVSDPDGARWNRRYATAASLACVALSAGVALAGPWLVPYASLDADGVALERPTWWEPGWGRNRDAGWTSPTGSGALSARTFVSPDPTTVDAAVDELVSSYRAVDEAVRAEGVPVQVDGVDGRRIRLDGDGWSTEALVLVRGRYVHTVAVDAPAGRFGPVLTDHVLASARLSDPDALREAIERGDTPRARIAQAKVLADLGRTDEALALLTGEDVSTTVARLGILADARHPDLAATAAASLARLPDDLRVVVAAARAWATVGDTVRREAVITAARARWPDDTALEKALASDQP